MGNRENKTTSQAQERITSEGTAPDAFAPLYFLNLEAFMRDPSAVVYTAFYLSPQESGETPIAQAQEQGTVYHRSMQVLFEAGQNGQETK